MAKIPSISDALKQVVAATEAALIADTSVNFGRLPKKLYFMHGHQKEVNSVLQSQAAAAATQNNRFPLIVLFRDIKEELSIDDGQSYLIDFKARLGIFTLTDPSYRSDDRERNNFKPILKPILEEFINQLTQSLAFQFPTINQLGLKYYDCYFYGSSLNGTNVFNDKVDAIEIESISLKLINTNCTSNKLIST